MCNTKISEDAKVTPTPENATSQAKHGYKINHLYPCGNVKRQSTGSYNN